MEEARRQSQVELYGEPISTIVGRIGRFLGLNQAQLARTMGLSAPMLSHLVAARRVKIGNPAALARLQQLHQLAQSVEAREVPPAEVPALVAEITGAEPDWGERTTMSVRPTQVRPDQAVAAIQSLFRQVAGATEWLAIADSIQRDHPAVAEALRAYGAARTDEALEHWQRQQG